MQPDLLRHIRRMQEAHKPIGAICIMPVVLAAAMRGSGMKLTAGNVPAAAEKIRTAGCEPVPSAPADCVVDEAHRVASA